MPTCSHVPGIRMSIAATTGGEKEVQKQFQLSGWSQSGSIFEEVPIFKVTIHFRYPVSATIDSKTNIMSVT